MIPSLRHVGAVRSPVVVVDGFSGTPGTIVDIAAALAPFAPSDGTHYPGLRRILTEADRDAFAYVTHTLQAAAPFIGGAFDRGSFDLLEASFSIVTAAPDRLSPAQRAPHFDSTDPDYIAILHYLGDTPGTGTAFYRQRSTGIEAVDDANVDRFVATARGENGALTGYTNDSNASFDQIERIDAVPDRLIIYQGRLLHSGIIPPDMVRSADPRRGRLTANLFIRCR